MPPAFASGPPVWRPEALAHFAAKAGFGPEEQLLHIYRNLPETYTGQLVNLNRTDADATRCLVALPLVSDLRRRPWPVSRTVAQEQVTDYKVPIIFV